MIDSSSFARWTTRGAFFGTLLACFLATGVQAQSTATKTAETTDGGFLKVSDSSIKQVDFDVPIPIKLDWPATMAEQVKEMDLKDLRTLEKSVEVYVLSTRQRPVLDRFTDNSEIDGRSSFERFLEENAEDIILCQATEFATTFCDEDWVEVSEKTNIRAEASGLYAILGRLQANKYYQFVFIIKRPPTTKERQAFQQRVLTTFDKRFRKNALPDDINDAAYKKVKCELAKAVEDEVDKSEGLSVTLIPGSLLYCDDKIDQIKELDNLGHLAEIKNFSNNRATHDDPLREPLNFNSTSTAIENAVKALQALIADSILPDVYDLTRSLNPEDWASQSVAAPFAARFHEFGDAALQLSFLKGQKQEGWLATGRRSLTQSGSLTPELPAIEEVWRTSQLQARQKNIETTLQTLSDVYALVSLLQRMKNAGAPTGNHHFTQLLTKIRASQIALTIVPTDESAFKGLLSNLKKREALFEKIIKEGVEEIIQEHKIYARATSTAAFETRANWYISADIGVVYASTLNEATPYVGANFYLRPVNKEASLKSFGFWTSLPRRVAFMVGFTTKSFKNDQREDLFANRALLLGVGLRISDAIRLSSGALVFKEKHPNPLISDTRVTSSPFISLSIDWDVKDTIEGVYTAIK